MYDLSATCFSVESNLTSIEKIWYFKKNHHTSQKNNMSMKQTKLKATQYTGLKLTNIGAISNANYFSFHKQ